MNTASGQTNSDPLEVCARMRRFDSESRIRLFVPSYLVEQPSLKLPPPVPGSVRPEDLLPQETVPRFLVPWPDALPKNVTNREHILDWGCNPHDPIPCEVNYKLLSKWLERYPVLDTIDGILKKCADSGCITDVRCGIASSLEKPFATGRREDDSIVWTLEQSICVDPTVDSRVVAGPKRSAHKHDGLTRNANGWSVRSFVSGQPVRPRNSSGNNPQKAAEATAKEQRETLEECYLQSKEIPVIRKNIIYNGDGIAIAQVDFGHGQTVGTHVHSLAENNLEHVSVAQEDHLFHFPTVPWPWLCIPIDQRYLMSEAATRNFFRDHSDIARTSTELLVPSEVQKTLNRAASKGVVVQQSLPWEVNPFAGHFPGDRFLTYQLPSTIDWDTYNDPSWRWLAIDLPFEDYSMAGMGSAETS